MRRSEDALPKNGRRAIIESCTWSCGTGLYEPRTRAASAPGRQPPARGMGRGASPSAGRGHRPPNPAVQGPSWAPHTTWLPHPAAHPSSPMDAMD
jgi:hypothetical protein